ncbi:hypothetical protein FYJ38_00240 [Clostridium sp. WB02_MRS01]|uniref:hypothetical protein n=1 Tax=Clostridium sp. WB02_MRS01 TaxID=2605777 RepID=UPI0012B1C6E2|nr:hypothetical protein [Clostridium sp. WB02_MRS01]MSS07067.1 hypothetical protein [Clostridium sp. WB02_MRS01]
MVVDFLNRNNNTDTLIILLIGMIIPPFTKIIYHSLKNLSSKMILIIVCKYKNYNRFKRGDYNIGEIIQIEEKPENKRTEKEKIALHKWNVTKSEINKSISKQADAMQVLNEKLSKKF